LAGKLQGNFGASWSYGSIESHRWGNAKKQSKFEDCL
jgi:hypothetical protein